MNGRLVLFFPGKATGAAARVSSLRALRFCALHACLLVSSTHLSAQLLLFLLLLPLQQTLLVLLCRNCCKIADIFPMITYSQRKSVCL